MDEREFFGAILGAFGARYEFTLARAGIDEYALTLRDPETHLEVREIRILDCMDMTMYPRLLAEWEGRGGRGRDGPGA